MNYRSNSSTTIRVFQAFASGSVIPREEPGQSLHLFSSLEADHFRRQRSLEILGHRPEISACQCESADDERFLGHLICGSEELPNRMVSKNVVLGAVLKPGLQQAMLCCS